MPITNLGSRNKDANDTRTYTIDWTAWLASLSGNDSITSVTWSVPAGLTQVSTSFTSTKTNVRISGGTNPTTYQVFTTVTTLNGEVKRVAFGLAV